MASPYNQQPPTWGQVPQAAPMVMPMTYTVARPPAKELYPKRWITVPILQLIFAIMAAGFAGYLISDRVVIAPIIVICAVSYRALPGLSTPCEDVTNGSRLFKKFNLANRALSL